MGLHTKMRYYKGYAGRHVPLSRLLGTALQPYAWSLGQRSHASHLEWLSLHCTYVRLARKFAQSYITYACSILPCTWISLLSSRLTLACINSNLSICRCVCIATYQPVLCTVVHHVPPLHSAFGCRIELNLISNGECTHLSLRVCEYLQWRRTTIQIGKSNGTAVCCMQMYRHMPAL